MDATHTAKGRVTIPRYEGAAEGYPVSFKALAHPVQDRHLEMRRDVRAGRPACCVLCKDALRAGDAVTMIHSHQKLFPSCCAHTACVPWGNLGYAAARLRDEWACAQQYAHWL
jgi:hypothetical protein